MAQTDWTNIAAMDQTARMNAFLKDAMYANIPKKQAAIVAAISINESGGTPFLPGNGQVLPSSCYPLRPVIRQERGTANQTFKTMSAASKAYLTEKGYLKGTDGAFYLSLGQEGHTDSLVYQLTSAADALEFGLAYRDPDIVKLFSIGMTQMYLGLSPLVGGSLTSRFRTWDLLWQFYVAQSVADLFATGAFDYLRTDVSNYPTDTATLDQVKSYLTNYQTGNVDFNSTTWNKYAQQAQSNIKWIWSLCGQLGYK